MLVHLEADGDLADVHFKENLKGVSRIIHQLMYDKIAQKLMQMWLIMCR